MNNLDILSCCVISKNDLLNSVDIDNKNGILTKIYTLSKYNVLEKYSYDNGEFSLFTINNDDTLSTVCSSVKTSTDNIIDIYTQDGVYIALEKEGVITYISYMQSKHFEKMLDLLNKNSSKPILSFQRLAINMYAMNHHLPIMLNDGSISDENNIFYKEFKELYNKYFMVSEYIPANNIINEILGIINKYIATR